MRKADIAADLDNPTASSAAPKPRYRIHRVCRREARRSFCDAGPATPSWATRGCARALDAANDQVSRHAEPGGLTDYCASAYIGMEAANSRSKLGHLAQRSRRLRKVLALGLTGSGVTEVSAWHG